MIYLIQPLFYKSDLKKMIQEYLKRSYPNHYLTTSQHVNFPIPNHINLFFVIYDSRLEDWDGIQQSKAIRSRPNGYLDHIILVSNQLNYAAFFRTHLRFLGIISSEELDKNEIMQYIDEYLSALQKSIRGSDVNASLHYAARLIEAEDLPSLARRLTVIAYEDIGLANPVAQIHTVTALEAAQKIGFPEARILIANVVVDLALSPKSNSAYQAMDAALADLRKNGHLPIPNHLRDGHYAGSKELGNAIGYQYPHAYPEKWVDQQYLPDKLLHADYFTANDTGKYERALGMTQEKIKNLKKNNR